MAEQQWPIWTVPALPGERLPLSDPARQDEIVPMYNAAAAFPETAAEARVREAWFFYRLHRLQEASDALSQVAAAPQGVRDARVKYLLELVRGQILVAQGRREDAMAAFRAALVAIPGATAARVALMAQLMIAGRREEAEALALALQSDADRPFDPWWAFWLGDMNDYQARLGRLRELSR